MILPHRQDVRVTMPDGAELTPHCLMVKNLVAEISVREHGKNFALFNVAYGEPYTVTLRGITLTVCADGTVAAEGLDVLR